MLSLFRLSSNIKQYIVGDARVTDSIAGYHAINLFHVQQNRQYAEQ